MTKELNLGSEIAPKQTLRIIVDTRESMVLPHLQNAALNYTKTAAKKKSINIQSKQITTGDYAFIWQERCALIIERKRLSDLSASIKDGRMENHEKLELLRKSQGCPIVNIIEGRKKAPHIAIGGITMKALQAKLDHLMIRDNTHIIYTVGPQESAERIFELGLNTITLLTKDKIKNSTKDSTNNEATKTNTKDSEDADTTKNEDGKDSEDTITEVAGAKETEIPDANNASDATSDKAEKNKSDIDTVLTKRLPKSDKDIYRLMYSMFPNISFDTTQLLLNNDINMVDLLIFGTKMVTVATLSKIQYPSGASIGQERAKKILECRDWDHSTNTNKPSIAVSKQSRYKKCALQVITSVPGISKRKGELILAHFTLREIIAFNDREVLKRTISNITVPPTIKVNTAKKNKVLAVKKNTEKTTSKATTTNTTSGINTKSKKIGNKIADDLIRILFLY
jgi:ERCC4-type nuclease